jgi:hypothetical protein
VTYLSKKLAVLVKGVPLLFYTPMAIFFSQCGFFMLSIKSNIRKGEKIDVIF